MIKIFKSALFPFLICLLIQGCEKEKDNELPFVAGIENGILDKINNYRLSLDLPPLEQNNFIQSLCRDHARNMAVNKVSLGHDGFEQRAEEIMNEYGSGMVAENVAMGYKDAESVVRGWLESPGHKANIEGDFNLTGIGVIKNNEGVLYYTQIFYHEPDK